MKKKTTATQYRKLQQQAGEPEASTESPALAVPAPLGEARSYQPMNEQAEIEKAVGKEQPITVQSIAMDKEWARWEEEVSGPPPSSANTLAAPTEDLEARVARRAMQMLAQERAALDAQRNRVARDKNGYRVDAQKRPPARLNRRQAPPDMISAIPDRAQIKPGFVPRWVRTVGMDGKPSTVRVNTLKADGYEIVRDHEGGIVKEHLGILMQVPEECYAERILKCAPTGAYDNDALINKQMQIVEDANRAAGQEAFNLYIGKDDGYERAPALAGAGDEGDF